MIIIIFFLIWGRIYSNLGEGISVLKLDRDVSRVLWSPSVAGRKGCWAGWTLHPFGCTVCDMQATAVSSWHHS